MQTHSSGTHIVMLCNMAIRIDINSEGPEVVVYLAGRLYDDDKKQLRDACDFINEAFVLDLSKLLFSDDAGIEVIRDISEQATEVHGASPFIQLLINKTYSKEPDDEEE